MSLNQKLEVALVFQKHQIYWTLKGFGRSYFTRQTLIDAISFLIAKCYFTIRKLVYKQEIGIPMGIGTPLYWANLFLYFFESKYVQQLISKGSPCAYKFHRASRFMDGRPCTINDDDECSSYKFIYPKQLELKLEHQGEHATCLDLDITIEDNIFLRKLFDKRDKFPFFIVRIPYLSSTVPSSIFYGSLFSEFL